MPLTMVSGATATSSGGGSGEPGQTLRLGASLGQGAVATVVLVTDEHGHRYAGKILHASHGQDDSAKARFAQEAELARGIVDDNVVRVFGRREVEGRDVLLMELVDSEDLGTFVARRERIEPAEVVALLDGIAAGLAAAHAAGIVHRDLKPSNVLLAPGPTEHALPVPKIADFGMARASSLSGVGSDAMTVLGTPDYMAPESLDPLAVDGRTDLYALGCIAFELLTGHPPYSAATPFGVLQAHRDAEIPALPDDTPPALVELVASLLAKSPADRPQAAEAVREHLAAQGPVTALALADAGKDRCSRCGGPLLSGLAVCLGCGQSAVLLEDGAASVVVTGPGEIGDKLDSALRDRLVRWLESSPRLGLSAASALERRIPRVPFTLVGGVSEATAAAIVQSLQPLGLVAEATPGSPSKLPAMSKKVRSMAGRGAAVAAGTIASMGGTMAQNPWMLLVGVFAFLGVIGVVVARTLAPGTKRTGVPRRALPAAVQAALGRVETAAPGIEHARHREALRAVVGRVLALAPADEHGEDPALTEELATAIDAATAAAGRLDALDRQLAVRGMSEASDETRALLHERDTWSARLLRLSATLESLGVRAAAAKAKAGDADDTEALDDLRAQVEALEEVQEALGRRGA